MELYNEGAVLTVRYELIIYPYNPGYFIFSVRFYQQKRLEKLFNVFTSCYY